MSFLPIVERELRRAARRPSSRRIRWWTALLGMLAAWVAWLFSGAAGSGSGLLFTLLSGYALFLCLVSGVLLTSDCLSQERREGTLGLLFLTDLHGYDVVLGKFMACSLNAFYALLALLPVTALPLLLGGVTGAEFWRTALALVNALFFSLAAGICVSAFSRLSARALRGAFELVLLVTAGLPALAAVLPPMGPVGSWSALSWLSPFAAFAAARSSFLGAGPRLFYNVLLTSHALAWALLGLASYALPRLLGRASVLASPIFRGSRGRSPSPKGLRARRSASRARRLPLSPIWWVVGEEPGLQRLVWLVVAAWGLAVLVVSWNSAGELGPLLPACKLCGFFLKLLVAFQACRFFVEARHSGALELLLCTPLRNGDILRGQWLAMRSFVFWPVVVAAGFGLVPFACQIANDLAHPAPATLALAFTRSLGALLTIGWFTLGVVADIFALTWVGMWLALSLRRPEQAALRTIFFVLVLPSIAICGTDLIVDLLLVLWSASRLQQDFRWVLASA